MALHLCTVTDVIRETSHCVSVTFRFENIEPPLWKAGQFVEMAVKLDKQWQARCFTLSQAPETGNWRVTVKDNGRGGVSSFINQTLKVGDNVRVSAPQGQFCVEPGKYRRTFYFWAAGSGITPIYAMASAILVSEPASQIHLLYANRDHKSIIFCNALEALQQNYPNRLNIQYALSNASWLSSFTTWHYGRVGQSEVEKFVQQYSPVAQNCEYYICGPSPFMQTVKKALMGIDVPEQRIATEAFSAQEVNQTTEGIKANLTLIRGKERCDIEVGQEETLLQASLASAEPELAIPYSCQAGVCGSCACRLTQGRVHMLSNMALSEQQVRDGWILGCQSVALTKNVTLELHP